MGEDASSHDVDVLVIGGGPAGIAVACSVAEAGRRVAVIDDNPAAGGQIWRGGAAGPGATRWFARLAASPAMVHASTAVIDIRRRADGPPCVVTRGPDGIGEWRPRALVKQGFDVRGRRVVIAGSGPLRLAVAEQASTGRLARFAASLIRHPRKLLQVVSIRRTIGPVLRAGTFPVGVRPDTDGLVVSLVAGGPGRERRADVACDLLACGFGLVPNVEVALACGCEVVRGGVAVNAAGRTTAPGVWAAGECTGVGGLDKSLVEGRVAGLAAAGRSDEAARSAAEVLRWRHFAVRLERTFALDRRLSRLAADDTIVCRCEDVKAGVLRCYPSWREAKLMTRIGMGPCQGRVCGPSVQTLFGWHPDDPRPPGWPVPLAEIVAPVTGSHRE